MPKLIRKYYGFVEAFSSGIVALIFDQVDICQHSLEIKAPQDLCILTFPHHRCEASIGHLGVVRNQRQRYILPEIDVGCIFSGFEGYYLMPMRHDYICL